jgi:hypothetical protein
MAMFKDGEQVFNIEGFKLGEFDISAEGLYRNVQSFPFKVKKRRAIKINVTSSDPIDVAVANERGSSVFHKQAVREGVLGPILTEDNKEMGVVIGIYKGDKATVSVEIWMEKP